MSSTDSASSQPPSIHWNGQNRLAGLFRDVGQVRRDFGRLSRSYRVPGLDGGLMTVGHDQSKNLVSGEQASLLCSWLTTGSAAPLAR